MAGNRRSIRFPEYEYRTTGAYFVTLCTVDRESLFGEIVDGRAVLNAFGHMLARSWARTVNGGRMPEAHDFVVMPNHVHGVVWLPEFRNVRARWV